MTYATQTRSTGASLVARLADFRATLADRYAKHKIYRSTVVELSSLSERDLADLGIHRSMIKRIASEAAELPR